ncbi:MAG: ABC transporter substrate-binding protein [Mesorhizobium sp.]|nr:ABC transporter substrate-binding protein [Mesorhizobium sp.]MCO5164591.1 ABC transporter substrate-binding protein [Mesorhizobium sp.]
MAAFSTVAMADSNTLRIGVLTDMSGMYADMAGPGSAYSAEQAKADLGGTVGGKNIEILVADHQNKPDVASGIARQWLAADGVDVIVNAAGSAVALAMVPLVQQYNKTLLVTGALSAQLSNEACSPNSVHYGLDTYALANGTVRALIEQGKKSFFFIAADYAFGRALVQDSEKFIAAAGGNVVGAVYHPLGSADFSSYLLQAQASGADIIAIANGGSDTVNTVSQASEFNVGGDDSQSLASLLLFITDVHSMGVDKAQGMVLTEGFYWNQNDESRAFSQAFYERFNRMPTLYQAADYSATRLFLETASRVDWTDGAAMVAEMKKQPIEDFFARGGQIREDGLLIHDLFLARIKKPEDVKTPWDYYDILQPVSGEAAFQPLSESRCSLVKN